MVAVRDPWLERRELIDHLIRDRSRNGTHFVCPPGVPLTEPSLLDNIQTDLLIKQLNAGYKVDLTKCLVPDNRRRALAEPQMQQQMAHAAAAAAATAAGSATANMTAPNNNTNPFLAGNGSAPHMQDNPFLAPPQPSRAAASTNPVLALPGEPSPTLAPSQPSALPPRAAPSTNAATAGGPAQVGSSFAGVTLQYNRQQGGPGSTGEGGSQRDCRQDSRRARLQGLDPGGLSPEAEACRAPQLNIPQLDAGVRPEQLKELAYVTLCACCTASPQDTSSSMLAVFRRQLGIDDIEGQDHERMIRHVPASWKPSQRASLELLVKLLEVVRSSDFNQRDSFKAFVRWRDTKMSALQQCLTRNMADSWTAGDESLARKMMARLKGAARRMDVRSEEEFEEEEYADAVMDFNSTARNITGCLRSGWRFTWGLRVRMGEVLLQAMFESKEGEQSCYIDDSVQAGQLLERCVWPVLGISPGLHLAINTWVHFRQYVLYEDPRLLRQVKALMARLAAEVARKPAASDHFGLGQDVVGTDASHEEVKQDRVIADQVGRHLLQFALHRLHDYYQAFPRGQGIQGFLDIVVSASMSRGHDANQFAELLVELVCTSTEVEYNRRVSAALKGDESPELTLRTMLQLALALREDNEAVYCRAVAVHLAPTGAAEAVSCARLYKLLGERIRPWLESVSQLSESASEVFQLAMAVDWELMLPVDELRLRATSEGDRALDPKTLPGDNRADHNCPDPSGMGTVDVLAAEAQPPPSAVVDALNGAQRWDMTSALSRVQSEWGRSQVEKMDAWTTRQLGTETWKPVSPGREGYAACAVEVSKFVLDTIEALFAMNLPVPKAALVMLLGGVDGRLERIAKFMCDKIGSVDILIPPAPPLTRYKKDIVAKQEKAELDLLRLKPTEASKKGLKVLESVPRIECSPHFTHIKSALDNGVLCAMAHSAHFLLARTDLFFKTTALRWEANCKQFSHPVGLGHQRQQVGGSPTPTELLPEGLFFNCRKALASSVHATCTFLATKIIFWDLRQEWLEQLYRHHVQPNSMAAIVARLNQVLATMCPTMPEDLGTQFVTAMLRASVQALERVYLDGGPCRWFIPEDVPMLEADLRHLEQLFHAEGDGLARDDINRALDRIGKLLRAMSLETAALMELVQRAKGQGVGSVTWKGQQLTYSESDAVRMLCHRPEWAGSKVLKEQFKIGKKMVK